MPRNARPWPLDLCGLLAEEKLRPVLVDIGASGGPPPVWGPIASESIYLGFDPDAREMHEQGHGGYFRSIVVNRAVAAGRDREVGFYFTRSPYCSSTLPPEQDALANYTFAPLFDVVRRERVPAVSLDDVIADHDLRSVDWMKIDSQGTDLRIFRSLREHIRRRVLAIDVEPGLIDAYEGEDLFVDVHRELCREGFWLSNLNVGGAVRFSTAALEALRAARPGASARTVDSRLRRSPAWCEARYVRSLESASEALDHRREFLLLATFSILDGQWGFAFETAATAERLFGSDPTLRKLKEACADALTGSGPLDGRTPGRVARLLRTALRRFRSASRAAGSL